MVMMIVAAPAALAQQGDGLCAGASAVETFSGTTSVDNTAPFDISTDTFQVAVEITPTNDSEFASASVFVDDDNFTTLTSEFFTTDNLSGVIPVENNGAGPFSLTIFPSEASYDITVYECGAATGGDMGDDNGMTGGDMDDNGMMDDDADDVNGGATAGQGAGAVQYDDGAVDDGITDNGTVDDGVADDNGMTALPDTGGPSILLLGGVLLMGAGFVSLLALRRRFS
jgi:hypothetical protein